jgi:hypothetical protein
MSGRRSCPDREALIDELEQQRATGGTNLPFEIGPVINTAKLKYDGGERSSCC